MSSRLSLRLILAGLVFSSLALFGATPVSAAKKLNMSINPSEQEAELKPGGHYEKTITVYNVGERAFDFEVSASPYQADTDRYNPNFTTENAYTKLVNWITFPETAFHLEPGRAAIVNFEITVPEDVAGGGQYAAIIIRTLDGDSDDGGMSVLAQLASIIYGHIEGGAARLDGTMIRHDFPSLMLGGELKISSTFENRGNIDFRVTENWEIRDLFTSNLLVGPLTTADDGQPIGTVTAAVLPGTKRVVDMVWKQAPEIGLFKIRQTISYLDNTDVYEKVVFLCPLWLTLLVTIFVVLIIFWIISIIIRHRRNKPQVF